MDLCDIEVQSQGSNSPFTFLLVTKLNTLSKWLSTQLAAFVYVENLIGWKNSSYIYPMSSLKSIN